MFKEYDCFRLCKPLPDEAIPVGTIGVVLIVNDNSDYEVEFPDGNGGNFGSVPTFTLSDDFMERVRT